MKSLAVVLVVLSLSSLPNTVSAASHDDGALTPDQHQQSGLGVHNEEKDASADVVCALFNFLSEEMHASKEKDAILMAAPLLVVLDSPHRCTGTTPEGTLIFQIITAPQ